MLTAYAAASAERLGGLLAMIGAVGVAVLAAALVLRIPALVTPALALLGAVAPAQLDVLAVVGPVGEQPVPGRVDDGVGLALGGEVLVELEVALALLGAEYAGLFVVRGDTLDVRAPLYGAAFLVVAELSFGALELRAGRPEPGLVPRRVAVVVGAAAAGVIVGLVVLAAAATPLNGGLWLEAAGIVAAVVLVAALGRAAVRSR